MSNPDLTDELGSSAGDGQTGPRPPFWARRKTWLLVVLGLALAAAGVGGYLVHRKQRQRHARTFLAEALKATRENRLADALRHCEGCAALAPEQIESYVLQVRLLRRMGETAAAEQCLARMVEANPTAAPAYAWRGRFRLEAGQTAAAEGDVFQAQQLAPDDHDVLLLVTEYWLHKGRFDLARTAALRLQTLFPADLRAYRRLAEAESGCGNREGALAALASGLQREPNNTSLYNQSPLLGSPYYRTPVGEFQLSDSPYGTFDQGGNVREWNDTVIDDLDRRGVRGGSYANDMFFMQADTRGDDIGHPWDQWDVVGFRLATTTITNVPEPSTFTMIGAGLATAGGLVWVRRRRAMKSQPLPAQ